MIRALLLTCVCAAPHYKRLSPANLAAIPIELQWLPGLNIWRGVEANVQMSVMLSHSQNGLPHHCCFYVRQQSGVFAAEHCAATSNRVVKQELKMNAKVALVCKLSEGYEVRTEIVNVGYSRRYLSHMFVTGKIAFADTVYFQTPHLMTFGALLSCAGQYSCYAQFEANGPNFFAVPGMTVTATSKRILGIEASLHWNLSIIVIGDNLLRSPIIDVGEFVSPFKPQMGHDEVLYLPELLQWKSLSQNSCADEMCIVAEIHEPAVCGIYFGQEQGHFATESIFTVTREDVAEGHGDRKSVV